jgi:hypothetical protein
VASNTANLNLRKPTNQDIVNVATDLSENFDKIDAHVTSPTAHSGTTVVVTPTGGIAATNVQAALAELDTEKATVAALAALAALTPAVAVAVAGVYPTRASVVTGSTPYVIWVGPTPPTIGGGYATDNLDMWRRTR